MSKGNINIISKETSDLDVKGGVYFLGIGGIGMSALARYFNSRGVRVSGYDKTPTELTAQLVKEGIEVHFEDDVNMINKDAGLVVFTPAIPHDHNELNFFTSNNYVLMKRSEVLGNITRSSFNICVAGTHGKTTTSSMIAHILRDSGFGCNAFLGGIAANYETNFWSNTNNVSVAEADEYDRSFLKLNPDVAVITSMDADHLDIYGTEENMENAFVDFTKNIRPGGILISKKGLKREADLHGEEKISYSLNELDATARAEHIKIEKGHYVFDVLIKGSRMTGMQLNMGGRHNIENAIASIVVSRHMGISDEKIKTALSSYSGVKRRFEYVLQSDESVVIDDYAHHPEELRALINGTKELYPGKKCTVVFQPHLFSRTKDLAPAFGEVLSIADEVILLPIYPARELPMPGVNSELILKHMSLNKKKVLSKDELLKEIEIARPSLLIIAGAGDIDTMVNPIKEILS